MKTSISQNIVHLIIQDEQRSYSCSSGPQSLVTKKNPKKLLSAFIPPRTPVHHINERGRTMQNDVTPGDLAV